MRYVNFILHPILVLLITSCSATARQSATITPAAQTTLDSTATPVATIVPPTMAPTNPIESPALEAGQWAYIFYHEELEQVVMVNGGPEYGKPAEEQLELWGWDGAQWSLIRADEDGPTWRNWAAAAYDTTRDVLVLHGGLQPGTSFDETWEWDGQTWTRFEGTDAGPGAREGALMAYDAARANTILFGGSTPDMQLHGDTWAWDGQAWTQVDKTGPAERFPGGMTYDAARQMVLMYSGHFASPSGEAIDYDDLWAWDGSTWREMLTDGPTPDHRTHAGFVYDPVNKKVLLVGSGSETFLSDMWAWDGIQWEEIPTSNTPVRSGQNVAYDPKRDRFVLFGGVARPGGKALDDTWEWDRVQWSCVNNCQ